MSKKSIFIKDGVNYTMPFMAISALFLTWGIAHGLLDTLDKNFQELLHLKKWQSSFIQVALYGAYFCTAVPAGLYTKKYGYKKGIILGLCLFGMGALLAAATAPMQSFVLFLCCLLIVGTGLATLETGANPYTTKLGPPESAERRINIAQSFNGFAWVVGPLIAISIYGNRSHVEGEKMISIIIPFAIIGLSVLAMAWGLSRLKLPKIDEEDLQHVHGSTSTSGSEAGKKPLWKNRHFKLGVVAQACYVAAQTGIFSYLINFVTDHDMHPRFDIEYGPYFLSFGFFLFMSGRFLGSLLMKHFKPPHLLAMCAILICILLPIVSLKLGWASFISLYAVFFLMSIMFPTIFALAIRDLGTNTKQGASFLVMSVGGGAVFPPLMGYVSDIHGMAAGFFVPIPLFIFIAYYAINGYKINA